MRKTKAMNAQILTGIIALLGIAANLAGVGEARAQDGHVHAEAGHAHDHADFTSGRFHVRVDGPDQPIGDIILIPGLASSPEVWDGLTDGLKDRYRIHRIHIQGFAGAEVGDNAQGPVAAPVAEDLARYIAEQTLTKPAVIGHSMGGTIGMMLAARHPDAVGRLMVIDMVPFMGAMFAPPGTTPTVETVTPIADQVHAGMADSSQADYRARSAAKVTGMIKTESARAGPLRDAATSDQKVSSAAYRELIVTDLRPELARITAPTEVVYVAFDYPGMTPALTDGIYQASFAALTGAKLKRIDDSGHFVMLDQPAAFAAEVNAFLE